MRWDHLIAAGDGVVRTFDTPGFAGMTFLEVRAKSIINNVPASSRMFFHWTINPYRGCSHACVYCYARNTHTYLDLGAGHDFDSKVIVKVNDVGPLKPGRVIDLNERSMRYFDPFLVRGLLTDVRVTLLPGEDWTPGPVGGARLISYASAL